jgi:hypothetical protein
MADEYDYDYAPATETVEPSGPPGFDPSQYVAKSDYETLQQKVGQFEQVQQGLKQALGVQPQEDPQLQATKDWLRQQGFLDRSALEDVQKTIQQQFAQVQLNTYAEQHGLQNAELAVSHFNYHKQLASLQGDTGKLNQFNQIEQLYSQGNIGQAVKLLSQIAPISKPSAPNMTIGHSLDSSPQGQRQFKDEAEWIQAMKSNSAFRDEQQRAWDNAAAKGLPWVPPYNV